MHSIKDRSTTTLWKYWQHLKPSYTSLIPAPHNTSYQPGGTLTLVGEPWSGRATLDHDPTMMGRWSTINLKGQNHRHLAIITAYRVVQTSITQCGPNTAYAQQWHHAKRNNHTNPQPRNDFLIDLQKYVQQLQHKNVDVMIAMDANAHLLDSNQQLALFKSG